MDDLNISNQKIINPHKISDKTFHREINKLMVQFSEM